MPPSAYFASKSYQSAWATISPTTRRDRLAVAEDADLDLDARLELLDEHLVVVAAGELTAASSSSARAFEIPTDEPRRAGLTKTG